MSDQPENQAPEAQQTRETKTTKTTKQAGRVGTLISLVGGVIAVIAIIAVGYLYTSSAQLKQRLASSRQQIHSLTQANEQINQQMLQIVQHLQGQQQATKGNQAAIAKIRRHSGEDQDAWIVEEASHLIKLANITLAFEHNVPAAVLLLKNADKHLLSISSPEIFSIREILADDIATLQTAPKLDVVGIYLRLQALRQQAVALPLSQNEFSTSQEVNVLSPAKKQQTGLWTQALHASSEALSKVLVIRHRQQPLIPLMSSKQHLILQQNTYLLFLQTQWAVLHRNNVLYQNNLKQLQGWVHQYYAGSAETDKIMAGLTSLEKINVSLKTPKINDALSALQAYQKAQTKKLLLRPAASRAKNKPKQAKNDSKNKMKPEEKILNGVQEV